jgi:hypothetical protein
MSRCFNLLSSPSLHKQASKQTVVAQMHKTTMGKAATLLLLLPYLVLLL